MRIPEIAEQFRWIVIAVWIKGVACADCLRRVIALAGCLVCMLSDSLHKMEVSHLGAFSSGIIDRTFRSGVMLDIDFERIFELFRSC